MRTSKQRSLIAGTLGFTCSLACAIYGISHSQAQTTVTEIRVVDGGGKGVQSRIKELTRSRDVLEVGDTDSQGYLRKPVTCPSMHRLFAEPVAGPYTRSNYRDCDQKVLLEVTNVISFPQFPVRLVVPFVPGGPSDQFARLVGQGLSQSWGQPVVIDNRAGAGGSIGTAVVAGESPNGRTLLWATSQIITVNPYLMHKLPYSPKDLVPVSLVVRTPEILVATPSFSGRSARDVVQLAKSKPESVKFASGGYGSSSHLAGELFSATTGVKLVHIPYKGIGAATAAVVGGQVELAFASPSLVDSGIKAGRLRAIGVTGKTRLPAYPEVPTISESGAGEFEMTSWQGVFGPVGLPEQIVRKIYTDIAKSLAVPEVRQRFAQVSAEVVGSAPDQFAAVIKQDSQRWARLTQTLNIRPH